MNFDFCAALVAGGLLTAVITRHCFPRIETKTEYVTKHVPVLEPFGDMPVMTGWERGYWRRYGLQLELYKHPLFGEKSRVWLTPKEWQTKKRKTP